MTRYAIFGKGRRVLLVKGKYFWLVRNPIFGDLISACAIRYGYPGWGFTVSYASYSEMNDSYYGHSTSILPWER